MSSAARQMRPIESRKREVNFCIATVHEINTNLAFSEPGLCEELKACQWKHFSRYSERLRITVQLIIGLRTVFNLSESDNLQHTVDKVKVGDEVLICNPMLIGMAISN